MHIITYEELHVFALQCIMLHLSGEKNAEQLFCIILLCIYTCTYQCIGDDAGVTSSVEL